MIPLSAKQISLDSLFKGCIFSLQCTNVYFWLLAQMQYLPSPSFFLSIYLTSTVLSIYTFHVDIFVANIRKQKALDRANDRVKAISVPNEPGLTNNNANKLG
jgi:hypothetical protein